MATVINNPSNSEENGGVVGMVIGIIILIVIMGLFFFYVLPSARNTDTTETVQNDETSGNIDASVTLPGGNVESANSTNN